MFTKAELLEQSPTLRLKPLHLLRTTHVAGPPESESHSDVVRGSPRDFENLMQFYCTVLARWEAEGQEFTSWETKWMGWVDGEIEKAICREIDWQEFLEIVALCFQYVHPQHSVMAAVDFKKEFINFRGALQMRHEWNEISVLAQFWDEFVWVEWSTAA